MQLHDPKNAGGSLFRSKPEGRWLVLALCIPMLLQGCRQKKSTGNGETSAIVEDKTKIQDPLPSWADDSLKQSLIRFVKEATDSSSPGFIPKAARIATFDNDGTLWAERPYVQELFAFFMVKKMVAAQPALAQKQPFKAVISKDKSWFDKGGEKAAMQLILATHTGMSESSFDSSVKAFFASATYPGLNVPVKKIVYQPQLELLQFLRDNGFVTFICTGGTVEFVRSVSQEFYGIPPHQVIGTTFKYQFVDSNRSIVRRSEIVQFNDKREKPVAIQEHIGLRPVFACGNEGGAGDIAMLSYAQGNQYPSFQLLVNHDDSTKEFFYQEKDSASLRAAAQNRWHIVSIRKNWKQVFSSR